MVGRVGGRACSLISFAALPLTSSYDDEPARLTLVNSLLAIHSTPPIRKSRMYLKAHARFPGGEGGSRTHIAGFSDRCRDHLGYRPLIILKQSATCLIKHRKAFGMLLVNFQSSVERRIPHSVRDDLLLWSDGPDSNRRPSPWQGDVLPTELPSHIFY